MAQVAAATRVLIGAALLAAPTPVGRPWAGPVVDEPGARLLVRSLGVRDLLLGLGQWQSLRGSLRGSGGDASAQPWLGYNAAVGAVDVVATAIALPSLPRSSRVLLTAMIGTLAVDSWLAATGRRC